MCRIWLEESFKSLLSPQTAFTWDTRNSSCGQSEPTLRLRCLLNIRWSACGLVGESCDPALWAAWWLQGSCVCVCVWSPSTGGGGSCGYPMTGLKPPYTKKKSKTSRELLLSKETYDFQMWNSDIPHLTHRQWTMKTNIQNWTKDKAFFLPLNQNVDCFVFIMWSELWPAILKLQNNAEASFGEEEMCYLSNVWTCVSSLSRSVWCSCVVDNAVVLLLCIYVKS